jgi:hypothetical protein
MTTLCGIKRSTTSNGQNRDEPALDQVISPIATLVPVVARRGPRGWQGTCSWPFRQRPPQRGVGCGYLRDDGGRFRIHASHAAGPMTSTSLMPAQQRMILDTWQRAKGEAFIPDQHRAGGSNDRE